jgi:hypothetical protein
MKPVKLSVIPAAELAHATPDLDKSSIIKKYDGVPFQNIEIQPTQQGWDTIHNGPYLISPHDFNNRPRHGKNWVSCEVLFIDFDSKDHPVTVDQITERLDQLNDGKGVNYYLNYSNGHLLEDGLTKFHIHIPMDTRVTDPEIYAQIREWAEYRFPEMDTSCKDLARFSFRGNPKYPSRFEAGKQELDVQKVLEELAEYRLVQANKKLQDQVHTASASKQQQHDHEILTLDTQVKTNDGKITKFRDLNPDEKPQFLCPICGEKPGRGNPGSHNATYQLSRADGKPIVYCSSCDAEGRGAGGKGVYNLILDAQHTWVESKNDFLVFRDKVTGKLIYRYYSKAIKDYDCTTVEMGFIKDLYGAYGITPPRSFPMYEYRLLFNRDETISEADGFINKFIPSKYMLIQPSSASVGLPKYTGLLLDHIAGHDKQCVEKFLDWLAYIVQKRRKTVVTFLFHGTEGTGKGMFYERVLTPIFGDNYTASIDMGRIKSQFNKVLEDNILILVDEVQADFTDSGRNTIEARVKMWITEGKMTVEGKGVDSKKVRCFANMLFFSNKPNAVKIREDDRRFNICPRQEEKLIECDWVPGGDPAELESLLESELSQFVQFLKQRVIDEKGLKKVVQTAARKDIISATLTTNEEFFDRIRALDWEWLGDNISYGFDCLKRPAASYAENLFLSGVPTDKARRSYLSSEEIWHLYNNIVVDGYSDMNRARFNKKASWHNLPMNRFRVGGHRIRGWKP